MTSREREQAEMPQGHILDKLPEPGLERAHHASLRRAGWTRADMLHHAPDGTLWRLWLELARPVDDVGILEWRWFSHADSNVVARLQTLQGETVADVSRGRAAGGFYGRIYAPMCWVIESDPLAVKARDEHGQAAVTWWAGPVRTKRKAAQLMLEVLHMRSVALFQVDSLQIPNFNPPR